MPRLEILSKPEQREFDSPPLLSGEVRKSIFRIDSANKKYIETIGGQEHRVAYLLMYNYFRLTRKFFLPQDFIIKDIEYVCRQLGIYGFIDTESLNNLSKSNLKRYRERILERSGFEAFDVAAKELLYGVFPNNSKAVLKIKFAIGFFVIIFYICNILKKSR